jgi:N12 class adenine-specific DNA methylase
LEITDEDGNLKAKSDMFTKRTIRQTQEITSVDTSVEALAVSIAKKARVDMPFMAQLTGFTEEKIAQDLQGIIFRDLGAGRNSVMDLRGMDAHEKTGAENFLESRRFVTADEYLSGNVRDKLAFARQLYEKWNAEGWHDIGSQIAANVQALEQVQPKDLEAHEIAVRLGSTWIDPEYYKQFMFEVLKTPPASKNVIDVNYSEFGKSGGEWKISGKNSVSQSDVTATNTFGTARMNAYQIMEDTLNLRDVRVNDRVEKDGKVSYVINKEATIAALEKQTALKEAFKDWIFSDPQRRQTLVAKYNEKFNSTRVREYDGSHIEFAGASPEISLMPHQRGAIARILYGGNTLLAHEVGAGKTFEMVGAAMESKRLGLCNKSMMVVPNHLTLQTASEFLRLYPSANVLVATKRDFEPKNRKKFCARIATGDYDAVIIGHSQFEKIPLSEERQIRLLREQIAEITDAIKSMKHDTGQRFTVKQMEKMRISLSERLAEMTDNSRKDDVINFEQLGIDRLFVDEAHHYKNLFLLTKMRNVAGISQTEAKKSTDMFMKCRYMDEITDNKGIIFATGTPVSALYLHHGKPINTSFLCRRHMLLGVSRTHMPLAFQSEATNIACGG